jgi:hypothetical protein
MGLGTFSLLKSTFIELDLSVHDHDEIESAFGKPIEVQLWYKKENTKKYLQNLDEDHLGSFFVDVNSLTTEPNKRIKNGGAPELGEKEPLFYNQEGYYTLYDCKKDRLTSDRLALKLYLFRKGNL